MKSNLGIGGYYKVICIDKNGNFKWREEKHNVVTDEGIDHLLNVHFGGTLQVDPWYVLLAGAGAKAATDTLASHAAWSEIVAYTGNRPEYDVDAASGKSITNSTAASFSINGDATVAGAGITTVTSGTVGTLFSVVEFDSSRTVASLDTLTVQYTLTGADA